MTELTRRGFLGAILAAGAAPAIVKAEIMMPVRKIIAPPRPIIFCRQWQAEDSRLYGPSSIQIWARKIEEACRRESALYRLLEGGAA